MDMVAPCYNYNRRPPFLQLKITYPLCVLVVRQAPNSNANGRDEKIIPAIFNSSFHKAVSLL
jgi:hypothetical protein